jgi:hypothetical protein
MAGEGVERLVVVVVAVEDGMTELFQPKPPG